MKKKTRRISHASARKKGHDFERKMAIEFQKLGFKNARRHLEFQQSQAQGYDLVNTGPFLIQCKKHMNYCSPIVVSTIGSEEERLSKIPLLITQANNKDPMVCMSFEDFKFILKHLPAERFIESEEL